jgi:hypothetical protein
MSVSGEHAFAIESGAAVAAEVVREHGDTAQARRLAR